MPNVCIFLCDEGGSIDSIWRGGMSRFLGCEIAR
jgi:hypothetical protein